VVIASIFLFVTLTITAAVVVFCKKRNSVFAFQKSEQEDMDYELDDINTDVEYTETDFESECEGGKSPAHHVHRSRSFHHLDPGNAHDSPARLPLVQPDSPLHLPCRCRHGDGRYGDGRLVDGRHGDGRGGYQKMVVTAVMEKGGGGEESDDSGGEQTGIRRPRNPRLRQLNKQYYGLTCVDSDPESGCPYHDKTSKPRDKTPVINITYADEPPNYESLNYIRNAAASAGYKVVVSMEKGCRHGNNACHHGDDDGNQETDKCVLR